MPEKREGPVGLIEVAIEPRSQTDLDRLQVALGQMVAEDPSFGFCLDRESGQIILTGVDERQLDSKIDVLKGHYGVQGNVGAAQVAYRETLGCTAEIDYTHKKHTGPTYQFARVRLLFEPGAPASGVVFQNKADPAAVPSEFLRGVTRGLALASEEGLLAGFPLIDFKATLIDGAFHDIDSSVLAFEIAARAAFKELREKGAPKLLEPIMKVEVLTPDEYLGDVIGDLNSRRGQIQGADQRGNAQVVTAFVPLAEMFGYASDLHVLTQESAQFTMRYDHYAAVPTTDPEPPAFPPAIGMHA